jgi:hypothetical protein
VVVDAGLVGATEQLPGSAGNPDVVIAPPLAVAHIFGCLVHVPPKTVKSCPTFEYPDPPEATDDGGLQKPLDCMMQSGAPTVTTVRSKPAPIIVDECVNS